MVELIYIPGKPDYLLACKLEALKDKLNEWSREEKGILSLQRSPLLNRMTVMVSIIDCRALDRGRGSCEGNNIYGI